MKLRELANRLNELADAHGDLGVESQIAVQNPHVVSAPVDFTLYATRKDDGSDKAVVVLGSFAAMRYDFPEEAEVVEATDDEIRTEFVKRFGEPDFSTATDDQFRHQYDQRFGVPYFERRTALPTDEDNIVRVGGHALYRDELVRVLGYSESSGKYLIRRLSGAEHWVKVAKLDPATGGN